MAQSSGDPPLFQFRALSLGENDSPKQQQPLTDQTSSTESFNFSFGSPNSSNSSDPDPSLRSVFLFGQKKQDSETSFRSESVPSQVKSPPIIFFGGDHDVNASPAERSNWDTAFSFRQLHNMTPLPSREPSREPTPQPASQVQSPSFESLSLSPQAQSTPTKAPRTASSSVSREQTHSPSATSSPSPVERFRSLSIASSAPTPSRARTVTSPPDDTEPPQPIAPPAKPPIVPYDVRNEPAPSHDFFTSNLQNALKNGSEVADSAAVAIRKAITGPSTIEDSDLTNYLEDAEGLQRFQVSDTRTIAVLGDSGQGKSSLINSLLHFPNIAQTGDIGSACTSVVTEYRQKKAHHVAPITIEVEYLSQSEMKELLHELLWDYRQLFLPIVESDATSEKEYAEFQRRSEQAWSALQALFKHKKEFNKKYAQDTSEGSLDRITRQLVSWANETAWPGSDTDGFWTSTAQTAEECIEQTQVFMQDKHWPFTKIIRVYLNSQVLKTGVILADLPGLQDTNLARVKATQDYLIKCDNILIVANIDRAITNESLRSSLFAILSRHVPMEWEQSGAQRLKIAVVCTKSDEINESKARSTFCGPNNRISPQVMKELDEEIASAKSSGDRKKKKAAKKKQTLLLVRARNEHVRESLQQTYAAEIGGARLPVFCISNTWYGKYCPKGNTDFVLASGVPDLRQFCHTITADAQLGEAKHFLRAKLSTLLNSLDLWVSTVQSREEEEVEDLDAQVYAKFDDAVGELPNIVKRFRDEFTACFSEQIMTFFDRRESHWKQAAIIRGREWMDWHWSQYNAWCLNNGYHATPKRDRVDWNALIIWKMRLELDGQWDLVEEEVSDDISAVLNSAKRHLEALRAGLTCSSSPDNVNSIVSNIDCQVQNLEYRLGREEREFLQKVRAIRRYTSETNYNSYILQDMIPVYREAASQRGTGKAARQTAIVQGHIEKGMVFPLLGIAVSGSVNDLVTATANKLNRILVDSFQRIRQDIDTLSRLRAQDTRLAVHDEDMELRVTTFSNEIEDLRQRHESLLRSIRSL